MRRPHLLLAGAALLLAAGCSAFVPNSRDELVGRWEGSVLFRSAMTPLVLEVRRGADSALVGVLSAPELLLYEQPVDSIVWDAPRVRFVAAEPSLPLRFEGFARAGRIVGRFTSAALPPIERVEALPKVSLRRVPVVAAPYELQHVTIDARGAGLSATLRLPADSSRHPGIVFVLAEPAPLHVDVAALADTFTRSGWATLTYERRGEPAVSLAEVIGGAASAARWLAAHPRVDGRVGVWGASLAGMLAPRVAAEAPLAFVVAVSPPGVSLQRASVWRDSVRGITREATQPRWGAAEQTRDPSADWSRVRVPGLLVFGDRDDELPVIESIRAIMQAAGAGAANVTLRVFPGAGHDLHSRARGSEPFDWPRAAPGYVDTLLAWTGRVAGVAPRPAPPDTGMPTLNLRPGWR